MVLYAAEERTAGGRLLHALGPATAIVPTAVTII